MNGGVSMSAFSKLPINLGQARLTDRDTQHGQMLGCRWTLLDINLMRPHSAGPGAESSETKC